MFFKSVVFAVSVPVFFSNFGYAGVLLLLLAAVIFMLNSMQKKTAAKLNRLNATYSDVETILVRVTNSLDAINLKLADLDAKQKYIADAEDRIRQEMTRLADGFGEQSQVSKAIDLAGTVRQHPKSCCRLIYQKRKQKPLQPSIVEKRASNFFLKAKGKNCLCASSNSITIAAQSRHRAFYPVDK